MDAGERPFGPFPHASERSGTAKHLATRRFSGDSASLVQVLFSGLVVPAAGACTGVGGCFPATHYSFLHVSTVIKHAGNRLSVPAHFIQSSFGDRHAKELSEKLHQVGIRPDETYA